MRVINKIKNIVSRGSERSVMAKKNIVLSFGLKAINIFVQLLIVPLTIDFVNPEMYGIWLTISSIIAWAAFFDLGFGNGFRNKFAETKANGDDVLATKYLSTTYAVLFLLFTAVFLVIAFANHFLSLSSLLNVSPSLDAELSRVFFVLIAFFCLNFVVNVINTFLQACQMPAISSLLQTIGQVVALIAIIIMTNTVEGSLLYLAFAYSGIPCLVLFVSSVFIFRMDRFKKYTPSFKTIDFSLTKNIMELGGKFFVITVSVLFIFQMINVILTRVQGPEAVTQYNVSYKYLHIIYMVVSIIALPIWSAFTDSYTKGEYGWMRHILKRMDFLLIVSILGTIVLISISPVFYHFWLHDKVDIPWEVTISTGVYVLSMTAGMVYMYMINGTGKIKLQLYTYVAFAFVSIPLLYYTCQLWGISGILLTPSLVYLVQALLIRKQLKKIINNTATGIWNL